MTLSLDELKWYERFLSVPLDDIEYFLNGCCSINLETDTANYLSLEMKQRIIEYHNELTKAISGLQ